MFPKLTPALTVRAPGAPLGQALPRDPAVQFAWQTLDGAAKPGTGTAGTAGGQNGLGQMFWGPSRPVPGLAPGGINSGMPPSAGSRVSEAWQHLERAGGFTS